jgi:hypothetical protein
VNLSNFIFLVSFNLTSISFSRFRIFLSPIDFIFIQNLSLMFGQK